MLFETQPGRQETEQRSATETEYRSLLLGR
jgi:hypothetical protein